jgi:hypothetical protein
MISIDMANKKDWDKRMKPKNIEKKIKMNQAFLIQKFSIEEVMDESGEVLEDTIIKFSFDGILMYLSVSNALKMNKLLSDILNLKK